MYILYIVYYIHIILLIAIAIAIATSNIHPPLLIKRTLPCFQFERASYKHPQAVEYSQQRW